MPKQVTIPFQSHWQYKMLNGLKTCSSRPKKYGNVDDWFEQFGARFIIVSINTATLEYIANYLYKEEGCDNPDEFKNIWRGLHPRKGWVPSQVVFTHFFRKEV